MIVVSYARYSSDHQRRESIEDQERKADKLVADKLGLSIAHRYRDQALSGWDPQRSDYQRLMQAARHREFQVLALDDLSRLGRDGDERGKIIRRLEFAGIRLLTADGYDSTMPRQQRVVHRNARGMIDSMYSIDLAEKTHRGQTGQALKGFNAGGRSYGYRHVPIEDPTRTDSYGRPVVVAVRRETDPAQADVVRRIFTWFADGWNCRAIAHELNRQRIPGPRGGTWVFTAIYGDKRSGVGLLNNPLYAGRLVWNRSRWERDPDTGKRRRLERDKSEWIERTDETLRIVGADLWSRVQARLAQRQTHKPGRREQYLWSGFLRCGICGGAYVKVDRYRYGCATHKDRGRDTCGNGLKVAIATADAELLPAVRTLGNLDSDEAFDLFRREASAVLRAEKKSGKEQRLRERLAALDREIANLVAAIKAGTWSDAVRAELAAAEAERKNLQAELAATDLNAAIPDFLPDAARAWRVIREQLDRALGGDVATARAHLRLLLGDTITLMPRAGEPLLEAKIPGAGIFRLAARLASGGVSDNDGSGGLLPQYLTLVTLPASGAFRTAGFPGNISV